MQNASLIEKQIHNCRDLLKVFKEERESYTDNLDVDLQMVMRMLNRKKEILTSFQKQKELMSSIKEQGHQNENQEKMLLRELGKVLEQLLVIDQENEILLRDQLGKKPESSNSIRKNSTLKPGLPFCPDLKTEPAPAPAPAPLQEPVVEVEDNPAMAKINRFSRMKLKAYGA